MASIVLTLSAAAIIVGGTPVPANHPIARQTVMILSRGACSGVLWKPDLVLTAAHCVAGPGAQVIFGTSINGFRIDAADYRIHPDWKPVDDALVADPDLALIRLKQSAPDGYKPARLVSSHHGFEIGDTVVVAGFGTAIDLPKNNGLGLLRMAEVPVVSPYENRATKIVLDQSSGRGACHGDSGGPAFFVDGDDYYVFAIAQTVDRTCDTKSFYTYLMPYRDWLAQAEDEMRAAAVQAP